MRKFIHLTCVLFFASLTVNNNLFAQSVRADSSSQQNALSSAINLFYASERNEAPLYNGPEYYFYDPTIKGNAYFSEVNAFTAGSVFYDGVLYNNVLMLYDLYKDKVVVLLYNHFSKFSLVDEKIKYFDFLGHHFINIDADTVANKTEIKSGIYDELYLGKIQVLEKRVKNVQSNSVGLSGPESYFNFFKDYYLKKGRNYYKFSGQGALLDILKDKKKELQQYIRSNQIKFRKDPDDAMVKIATYYDRITN